MKRQKFVLIQFWGWISRNGVKVIVIDNSSANDSYKKLCETYSGTKVELLQTEYNCGFSAANNIAYEYCKKSMIVIL